ncbi:IS5/IS1182 family transposase, partial [Enterococcus durans]
AKIDIGLALMVLNLRKLAKYMKGKVSKIEKIRPILILYIKIRRLFFLRRTIVPDSFLFSSMIERVFITIQKNKITYINI